jgi:GNAT superfamily N-acetyltransferase
MTRATLQARALRADDWPHLATLFGARGACGGCWCMAWRRPRREWEAGKGESNRRALKRLVESGRATGCLAFAGDECVGWCSLGPRADFPVLQSMRSLRSDWDEGTWSATCFFIRKDWRGRGVSAALLRAAVALAREIGATRLEGYPVAPAPGFERGRMPSAFAWTGLPQVFERAGFRALPDPPGKRPVYVRRFARRG